MKAIVFRSAAHRDRLAHLFEGWFLIVEGDPITPGTQFSRVVMTYEPSTSRVASGLAYIAELKRHGPVEFFD